MSSSRLDQLKRDLHVLAPGHGGPVPALDRGQSATSPHQIPMPGWKDIVVRSWNEVSENNIFLVAGGVTYAVLLALFPGLAALVSIYGLLLDPAQVEHQVAAMSVVLPPASAQMIGEELRTLVSASQGSLGISAGVALLLALWSASRGMSGLLSALNIAYDEKETRSFLKVNFVAIALTIAMLIGGTVIIALVGVVPAALQFVGHARDRNRDEPRIADELVAVGVSEAHRLRDQVPGRRRVRAERRQVEPLELLEDREHRGSARRGRAHAADAIAAVRSAHRVARLRFVGGDIADCHARRVAWRTVDGGDDRLGIRPDIETVRTACRDVGQQLRERRIADQRSRRFRRPIRRVVKRARLG